MDNRDVHRNDNQSNSGWTKGGQGKRREGQGRATTNPGQRRDLCVHMVGMICLGPWGFTCAQEESTGKAGEYFLMSWSTIIAIS